jgi:hypothetical protein
VSHLRTLTRPSTDRPSTRPLATRRAVPAASHPASTGLAPVPCPSGAVIAPLPRRAAVRDTVPAVAATVTPIDEVARDGGEEGSLVAEYGLLAVVAATVAGVLITWASSGALASFFGQLLEHARSLVVS